MFLSLLLTTLISSPNQQEEIATIDRQISQLQDLQRRYESSMERNLNDALRWQFQRENSIDARRAWDRAAQEKQKIQEIRDQINDLRRRRSQILKEHED